MIVKQQNKQDVNGTRGVMSSEYFDILVEKEIWILFNCH